MVVYWLTNVMLESGYTYEEGGFPGQKQNYVVYLLRMVELKNYSWGCSRGRSTHS